MVVCVDGAGVGVGVVVEGAEGFELADYACISGGGRGRARG